MLPSSGYSTFLHTYSMIILKGQRGRKKCVTVIYKMNIFNDHKRQVVKVWVQNNQNNS